MSAVPDFAGRGLSREDEVLAKVVLDLGLANQGAVENAVGILVEGRSRGSQKTLAQILQETGCLNARFAAAVEKAVHKKLGRAHASPSAADAPSPPPSGTRAALEHEGAPRRTPLPPPPPAPEAKPDDYVIPEAARFKDAPKGEGFSRRSKSEVASAWAEIRKTPRPVRQAPGDGGLGTRDPGPPGETGSKTEDGGLKTPTARPPSVFRPPSSILPEAAVSFDPFDGGGLAGPPEGPHARGRPAGEQSWPFAPPPRQVDDTTEGTEVSAEGTSRPRTFSVPSVVPDGPHACPSQAEAEGAAADDDFGPPGTGPAAERRKPRAPVELGVGLRGKRPDEEGGRGRRGGKAADTKPVYKRQRFASSGVTQQIDVGALRAEMGLEGEAAPPLERGEAPRGGAAGPAPEAGRTAPDGDEREASMRAFVRRVVPSRLHQQLLTAIIRQRLATVTPDRLAEAAGIREREARSVLESWCAAGVFRQDDPVGPFQMAPSRADLAQMKEFLLLWNKADWHNRLLGWILEEEA